METRISCPLSEMQTFWYRRLLLKESSFLAEMEGVVRVAEVDCILVGMLSSELGGCASARGFSLSNLMTYAPPCPDQTIAGAPPKRKRRVKVEEEEEGEGEEKDGEEKEGDDKEGEEKEGEDKGEGEEKPGGGKTWQKAMNLLMQLRKVGLPVGPICP